MPVNWSSLQGASDQTKNYLPWHLMPAQFQGNADQTLGALFNPRTYASHTEIQNDRQGRSYSDGRESNLNLLAQAGNQ